MATLALGALAASCADEFDQTYSVAMPQSLENYAYLADYKPLRDYVTNSNFKLGGAIEASDFNDGGVPYQIAVSNFHEVVAGNAMKMASCVGDDGTMDFSTVQKFVDNAEAAGVSVFGHTLAWHAQQPKTWLETLIADKEMEVEGDNAYLAFTCAGGTNSWDQQAVYTLTTPMEAGKNYVIKAKIKTDDNSSVQLVPIWSTSDNLNQWGNSDDVEYLSNYTTTDAFVEYTWDFTPKFPHDKLQFFIGKSKGDVCFDDLSCTENGSEADMVANGSFDEEDLTGWSKVNVSAMELKSAATQATIETPYDKDLITNTDCEGENVNYYSTDPVNGISTGLSATTDDATQGKCMIVKSPSTAVYSWDSQFFIKVDRAFKLGEKAKLTMKIKADVAIGADGCQAHGENPGAYKHWEFFTNPTFTTTWADYESEITINSNQEGAKVIAFNLCKGAPNPGNDDPKDPGPVTENTYYFDDIQIHVSGVDVEVIEGAKIALTDEEKKDTLTWAMDKWIGGMMEACGGKVKAWDVVNEAISGADKDGDGFYDLQHGSADNTTDFFWQDYFGDVDYVRTAVASARKQFAANGGNASDLKLFINDYNLEASYDENKKLKSLINWIAKWEADGTTKIDGIGSQMHVTYSAKAEKQQKQEECVVNMLKLMAETGKLVRISELDMGYEDANGIALETSELTEEQHKQMAAFYSFIVRKYLEIVPEAQQYGITQWCLTDSPASSSWRTNEPTGLWDLNYNRKHTYAGFAEGLQGNEYNK